MKAETMARLAEKLAESAILRARDLPRAAEVDEASKELGVEFSPDYREFLLEFGAAMVGPYPIYGLRPVEVMGDDDWSVVVMTKFYRAQEILELENWVVISANHAGSPVGMDSHGVIWVYDHDFGVVSQLAGSFEDYLRRCCLGIDAC